MAWTISGTWNRPLIETYQHPVRKYGVALVPQVPAAQALNPRTHGSEPHKNTVQRPGLFRASEPSPSNSPRQ